MYTIYKTSPNTAEIAYTNADCTKYCSWRLHNMFGDWSFNEGRNYNKRLPKTIINKVREMFIGEIKTI